MKEIQLSKGFVTQVDDSDHAWLSKIKWRAMTYRGRVYAVTSVWSREKQKTEKVLMHRLIMNAVRDEEIDHRRGIGLDNQRHNLRKCTHAQNIANQGPRRDNKCGRKGIRKTAQGNWQLYLKFDGKLRCLGTYREIEKAAAVYSAKAMEVHGEFARTA